MVRNDKGTLILIIVLLIIFVPLSLITITYKFKGKKDEEKEPVVTPVVTLPEFYENGKLNFISYNTFLGSYTCNNTNETGYCGYAYETIDDDVYNLNYYEDNYLDEFDIINSRFAFLVDTDSDYNSNNITDVEIVLYDILEKEILSTFKGIKNYTIGLDEDYFIAQDINGLWGVIKLSDDGLTQIIPFEFDYIGVQNNINNETGLLNTDMFIGMKDNYWYILDKEGTIITTLSTSIYQYDENVIIGILANKYYAYNYNGTLLLNSLGYDGLKIVGKYLLTFDTYGKYQVIDYNTNEKVSTKTITLSSIDDLKYDFNEDGTLNLYKGDSLIEIIK